MDHIKRPEELRAEYRERQRLLELAYEQQRKALIVRWTWAAAGLGLIAALINYLACDWFCIMHMVFCAALANALLRFHRGQITGAITFGFGNSMLAFLHLYHGPQADFIFNPFGPLAFTLVGAMIGIGMRIQRFDQP
jgi:hypothetical protein